MSIFFNQRRIFLTVTVTLSLVSVWIFVLYGSAAAHQDLLKVSLSLRILDLGRFALHYKSSASKLVLTTNTYKKLFKQETATIVWKWIL